MFRCIVMSGGGDTGVRTHEKGGGKEGSCKGSQGEALEPHKTRQVILLLLLLFLPYVVNSTDIYAPAFRFSRPRQVMHHTFQFLTLVQVQGH